LITRIANGMGANRVVLALSIARLADALGNSILFIIIPLYVAQLPDPWFPFPEPVRVGVLISLYGIVNAILQPVMGAVSDRIGRRKVLIQLGLAVMGITTVAFIFTNQFTGLLILRSLQGIGVALTIPASMALMALAANKQTRGGSMGIYSTMRMVGFGLGPLLGGFLQVTYGYNAAFIIGALFVFLGIVLVQVWVAEIPTEKLKMPVKFKIIDRELLSAGIVGAAVATLIMSSDFSMMTTLETQFNARLNMTALGFSIAFSALMLSRLIFQIPLGRWSDRIGRKPLIIGGMLLMAPSTALLAYAGSLPQLTLLRIVQGFASAGVAAPAFALAADLAKAGGEGRQMSFITMGFGLGIAIGPLIAGLLAVYAFELPFIIGGIMSIAGGWIVYQFVPETIALQPAAARAGHDAAERSWSSK
jgi:MFS family permease